MHNRHDDRIKIEALLGQDVFVVLWRFLIWNFAQHAEAYQLLQSVGEQMASDF
jgi:hypothetical protein